MSRTGRKILVAAATFVLAGTYLAYSGARNSMAYYLTVGELLDRAGSVRDADIRLGGRVAAGGVVWDQVSGDLAFQITDGSRTLPVRYRGVVPDAFKPGADVVVEGRFDGTTFQARRLFAKCPSKFEAKPPR
ncbi:MAG: cytochrome c maturation protein CcmE [Armatimonadota bacterium]|nr:cytochrome c maturation protein CcmE [Armatimonadota bacterium]MDR7451449.1 cytochrome c maturation protein CcmE [Armatimonadota bacterium]MDR7466401.1 cytochrome c maturation protein CcmE [Armatimonadota bacterium]MDR7493123.1 cytochrome c maturation protein CcmE [Armatimonadota bacterium]MDR7498120.1 cytochrome c maturation protein CcmE [Armatimonadota bacterium]